MTPDITATVSIWGQRVGAVLWDARRRVGVFEYEPAFARTGVELAPLTMPLPQRRQKGIFIFPTLNRDTYQGLPGLLADSLPDRYGRQLIDAWLASKGRDAASFTPVEHLCYLGHRGMGALVYEPALQPALEKGMSLEVGELVKFARQVLTNREGLHTSLATNAAEGLAEIISVGTSAGGARAKAVIAYNASTQEVRSGQVDAPDGFEHWLLKLDGVTNASLGDPAGYGRIEYAYFLMAQQAGLHMTPCRLLEENGRAHFMTRRFDRVDGSKRLHMQTLCGLAHFDYNQPGAYTYEQAFQVILKLRLPHPAVEELYRRMVFNVVARNQDDHTKNISFLMNPEGKWSLSPAYDVTHSYNPTGEWSSQHQMSIAGKVDDFTEDDFLQLAKNVLVKKPREIIQQVVEAVANWPKFAAEAGVPEKQQQAIAKTHRLQLFRGTLLEK
ncbi:serine/threonine-protein kinase HipA [Hymenobacter luteus]|uniref:Serine/threonine-protein kinase HipA n=2 Tax=Hymenobacter TaxID=89966 RepID=A0A7W9WF12_9BACT|nr:MULTISPECIES: type II toxin-antitoxin system HipA family toxin [Hymenobacter]MBB4603545.1 serine/threonine-protein kinase HipA [Hymenobacter latericoloratus]MBB6061282.1 serine/threonine-protein kinase HipA [Hymenobacter luteus]